MERGLRRPSAAAAQLTLRVPPDPRMGRRVRESIVAFAQHLGITDIDVSDFISAVGEAVANAMEHAGTTEPIEISAWLTDDGTLIATIVDHGSGFTPTSPRNGQLPDVLAERGRGLPIMRRCADLFEIASEPGIGTRVTLGRRLLAPTGGPQTDDRVEVMRVTRPDAPLP